MYFRCRQFPSLINCTTIDWFSPWPAQALLDVATRYLEQLSLEPQPGPGTTPARPTQGEATSAGEAGQPTGATTARSMVQRVAELCVEVHKSVEAATERYYQELRRRYGCVDCKCLSLGLRCLSGCGTAFLRIYQRATCSRQSTSVLSISRPLYA